MQDLKLFVGKGHKNVDLLARFANRHGLIAGATGTGKTVSLQLLADNFSRLGVPIFMSDVKGDLSGIAAPGGKNTKVLKRLDILDIQNPNFSGVPTVFWDVYGEKGHPIRSTISEMGPMLLSRILGLNNAQEAILLIAFRYCDEAGMLLIDLKDLQAVLRFIAENTKELKSQYGNINKGSIGAVQSRLLVLEQEAKDYFFGEPAISIQDFFGFDSNGYGQVNILAAERLIRSPRLYSVFLLWMLSELFEELPEVGDMEKPKLVFFFDEAHLLFKDAPKLLINKIEQVIKLIRSKGVGIFFITQNPCDIPSSVLGQLSNRIVHALRSFTPKDEDVIKSISRTFRQNPAFDTKTTISELKVGEALVSTLDEEGAPTVVERTLIAPPLSRIGSLDQGERDKIIKESRYSRLYDEAVDRESAYEKIAARLAAKQKAAENEQDNTSEAKPKKRSSNRMSIGEAIFKSTMRSIGSRLGTAIVRGVLGSILKK